MPAPSLEWIDFNDHRRACVRDVGMWRSPILLVNKSLENFMKYIFAAITALLIAAAAGVLVVKSSASRTNDVSSQTTTHASDQHATPPADPKDAFYNHPTYMLVDDDLDHACEKSDDGVPSAPFGNTGQETGEELRENGKVLMISGKDSAGSQYSFYFFLEKAACDSTARVMRKSVADTTMPPAKTEDSPPADEESKTSKLSDATDPSGLAQLFLGQVVIFGNQFDMKIDDTLSVLLAAVMVDATPDDPSPEGIKAAFKGAHIISIENGNATWNGRTMPASWTVVDIETVNRQAGTYGHTCLAFGGLRDREFDYIRSPVYASCDGKTPPKEYQAWKQDTTFVTTETYQFADSH
jgi:hypothetical protein